MRSELGSLHGEINESFLENLSGMRQERRPEMVEHQSRARRGDSCHPISTEQLLKKTCHHLSIADRQLAIVNFCSSKLPHIHKRGRAKTIEISPNRHLIS